MPALQIIQGQTGYVNPVLSILDTGWTISGGFASHTSCNAGVMKSLNTLGLIVGRQYTVTYTVDQYKNNGVNVTVGTTNGITRTANGTYTETITCTSVAQISFFSDGALRISGISIFDTATGPSSGVTVCFNERHERWGCEYGFVTEMMVKFIDSFFAFKNGQLWEQNVNPIRNNFFGVQTNSQVLLYANIKPTEIKLYYSMRVQSNRVWSAPNDGDINIRPVVGRASGMQSRLKSGNFKNYQGSFYADFMRNLLDNRFNTTTDALYRGEPLRGRYMEILLTNTDTDEVILFELDIKSAASAITY